MDPLVHLNFFRTNLIGKKKHFTVLNRTLSFSEQFVGFLIAAIYCLNRLCNVSLNLLYLTVLILHLANLINRENNHCVQFNAIGVIPSNLREHPRDAFLFPPKGVVCDLMQITVGLEPYGKLQDTFNVWAYLILSLSGGAGCGSKAYEALDTPVHL